MLERAITEKSMGEEQTFCPQVSFSWSNNHIGMREISKRKEPNLIYRYVWEPHIRERVRDPTCTRRSETEREHVYIGHSELGVM